MKASYSFIGVLALEPSVVYERPKVCIGSKGNEQQMK